MSALTQQRNEVQLKTARQTSSKLKRFWKSILNDKYLYMMLIPFLAFYVVFKYAPMYGLQIAFKNYSLFKGIEASPWVGLENFQNFFTGPYFFRTLCNTILINLYGLLFSFPIPIILALMFHEVRNKFFQKLSQTLVYAPHFVSIVVVAGLVTNLLSPNTGVINSIIEQLGGERQYFLIKPEYFRTIFTSMNIWQSAGFASVIYIAALSGVDQELYEAASIDGANKWRQLWNVSIPGILPTIIIMLILRIGHMLDVGYESIILLYQPATYETADVISTYVYRAGLQEGQYSLASAVGFFNGLVGLILVYCTNRISKKITENGLW